MQNEILGMEYNLTQKELDEIIARCNSSSLGVWKSYIEGRDHISGSNFIMVGEGESRGEDIELLGATAQDQDFIANAKQDIPKLIKEILRLQKLIGTDSGISTT